MQQRHTATGIPSGHEIRVVLYSHDSLGLGHLRRNLLIGGALVEGRHNIQALLITGTGYANAFRIPHGVDIISIPSWTKIANGRYEPYRLRIDGADLSLLRAETILSAIRCFEPDLFVVDKVPRGVRGELDRVLAYLRDRGSTKVVLGLRDILDLPERVRQEWDKERYPDVISKFYDAVWVYGDRAVYDPTREYAWSPEISDKTFFTGYIDRTKGADPGQESAHELMKTEGLADGFNLCVVGGGADGFAVARSVAEADPGPRGTLILTGPFMPPEQFARLGAIAEVKPNVRIARFCNQPVALFRRAGRVVCMGGYNTLLELVGLGIRPLVVPRIQPRAEQLIRATRFRELELADVLHPDDLSPTALSEWLHKDGLAAPRATALDLKGLTRIVDTVQRIKSGFVTSRKTGGGYATA